MAAAAVEMVDYDPNKIPQRLIAALQLDESRRPLLARFLVYLRKHLANTETYSRLIQYADELEKQGYLAGLSKEVADMAKDTRHIKTLLEMMASEQGLTGDDQKALEEYLSYCRERWGRVMLPLVRKNVGPLSPSLKRIFEPLLVRDEKAEEEIRKKAESRRIRTRLDEVQEHRTSSKNVHT